MKKQHTPGPWAVSPYMNITSRNGTVAKTEQMPGNDDSEREANAHLIAAAPDMLSALQQMLNADYAIQEGFGEKSDQAMLRISAIDSAQRAIAKAKGEV